MVLCRFVCLFVCLHVGLLVRGGETFGGLGLRHSQEAVYLLSGLGSALPVGSSGVSRGGTHHTVWWAVTVGVSAPKSESYFPAAQSEVWRLLLLCFASRRSQSGRKTKCPSKKQQTQSCRRWALKGKWLYPLTQASEPVCVYLFTALYDRQSINQSDFIFIALSMHWFDLKVFYRNMSETNVSSKNVYAKRSKRKQMHVEIKSEKIIYDKLE